MTEKNEVRTWPLAFGARAVLDFRADHCAVRLRPVRSGEAPALTLEEGDQDRLRVEIQTQEETVRVSIHALESFPFGHQRARVTLSVPSVIDARVRTDAGQLDVRDLGACKLDLRTEMGSVTVARVAGWLRVRTAAGSIEVSEVSGSELDLRSDLGRVLLEEVHGRLRLRTEAGQIAGRGLSGMLDVRSDLGAVALAVRALDPGDHRVRTAAGKVEIALNPEISVRIETRARMGSVRNELPRRPDGLAVLQASTDLGSVRIRRLEESASARPVSPSPASPPPAPPAPPAAPSFAAGGPWPEPVRRGEDGEQPRPTVEREADGSVSEEAPRPPAGPPPLPDGSAVAVTGAVAPAVAGAAGETPGGERTAAGSAVEESPAQVQPAGEDGLGLEEILARVAAGTLSPGDANDLLARLERL